MESVKRLKLESSRLILEPISMDYAEVIFQEFTAEITQFMHPKPAESINETMQFIRDAMRHQKNGTDFTFVILKKDNLEFLGVCGIHRINTETPELGIWTKKAAHGHGYGREAIHCLKAWVDEIIEYQYLLYPVDKRNTPSQRIPESLKGKPYREYTQLNLSGHTLNVIEYRIYR